MKNFLWSTLAIIIGGVVVYYLNKDKVDVRYSLSENIPLSFYADTNLSENVQQLEIKNTGDILVKKIVIKINKPIIDFSLKKYAQTDSVYISKKTQFEINYSELPPKGSIKLIVKTKDNIIKDEDVEIYDDKGIVYEAFKDSSTIGYLSVGLICFYLTIIIYNIYKFLVDEIQYRSDYNPLEKILMRNKPFYISNTKWDEFRKNAIKRMFRNDHNFTLQGSIAYKLLIEEKNKNITESEWITIVSEAQNEFKSLLKREYLTYYNFHKVLDLKKPKNYDDDGWNKIIDIIGGAFSVHKLQDFRYEKLSEIQNFLVSDKPLNISKKDWERLLNLSEDILIYRIIDDLIRSENAPLFLKTENIQLPTKEKNESICKIAEKIAELYEFKAVYMQLEYIIKGFEIEGNRPEEINQQTWDELKKFSDKIKELKQDANDKFNKAIQIEKELKPVKEKVINQLSIIDNVLCDPEFINKIESYQNDFSSGNFKNLQRLALLNNIK